MFKEPISFVSLSIINPTKDLHKVLELQIYAHALRLYYTVSTNERTHFAK